MSEISPFLERDYGEEVLRIVDNFTVDPSFPSIQNIDRAFYVFTLMAMSEDIMSNIPKQAEEEVSVQSHPRRGYNEVLESLL